MSLEEVFNIIDKITLSKGNVRPSFTSYHIYLTLSECAKAPSGRKSLSNILGIGEGSVRTLIKRLSETGLITVDPVAGVLLTEVGLRILKALTNWLVVVGSFDLSDEEICRDCRISAVLLRDGIKFVKQVGGVLYVRDLIVKKGGIGGLIIYYVDGAFMLPNSHSLYKVTNQGFWRSLLGDLKIFDGDSILVSVCRKGDRNCLMYVFEAALDILRGATQ